MVSVTSGFSHGLSRTLGLVFLRYLRRYGWEYQTGDPSSHSTSRTLPLVGTSVPLPRNLWISVLVSHRKDLCVCVCVCRGYFLFLSGLNLHTTTLVLIVVVFSPSLIPSFDKRKVLNCFNGDDDRTKINTLPLPSSKSNRSIFGSSPTVFPLDPGLLDRSGSVRTHYLRGVE